MKFYLVFILVLISYIAANPIAQNIPDMSTTHIVKSKVFFSIFLSALFDYYLLISYQIDDAQQPQMANLMDGRSFDAACENRCKDLLQDCLDVDGGGDAGCWGFYFVCKGKC